MDVERSIERDTGLVTMTVSGRLELDGMRAALQAMLADPDFRPGADIIWDLRKADASAVTGNNTLKLSIFVEDIQQKRGANYRVAIVADRDLCFGFARMYEMYASKLPFECQVFRNMDDARQWVLQAHS